MRIRSIYNHSLCSGCANKKKALEDAQADLDAKHEQLREVAARVKAGLLNRRSSTNEEMERTRQEISFVNEERDRLLEERQVNDSAMRQQMEELQNHLQEALSRERDVVAASETLEERVSALAIENNRLTTDIKHLTDTRQQELDNHDANTSAIHAAELANAVARERARGQRAQADCGLRENAS